MIRVADLSVPNPGPGSLALLISIVTGLAMAECINRVIKNIVAITITIPNNDRLILEIEKINCSNYK